MTAHAPFDDAVAAYALGALDPEERRAFEEHLASCAACQRELASFNRVAAGLALAVEPAAPPASLKARTIANATRLAAAPRRAPARSLAWLPIAAALALAVGLATYAASLRFQIADLRRVVADASTRAESLRAELAAARWERLRLMNAVDVLGAPDLIRVDLRAAAAPGVAGRAYMSPARGLYLSVDRLPALPAGRVYQLWVIPAGAAPVSAGVFQVDASGASTVATTLPATAQPIKTVAVTVENGPAGSPAPTTPVVLAGAVRD